MANSKKQFNKESVKKKIFNLGKMEALVHSDPKLSARYHEMSNHEEKFGFHTNENIMVFLFNEIILNSAQYLQKYIKSRSVKKERRDQTGIRALEKKGEEEMIKKGDVPPTEKEENVEESTGASSSGAFMTGLDYQKPVGNDIDESTGASSSGAYASPFAWSKNGMPAMRKPIFPNGTVIGESNYLLSGEGFEKLVEMLSEGSIEDTYYDTHIKSNNGLGVSEPPQSPERDEKIKKIEDNTMLYVGQDAANLTNKDLDILHNDMTKSHSYFPHPENENLKDDGVVSSLKEDEDKKAEIDYISTRTDAYGNELENMNKSDINIIMKDQKNHTWDEPNIVKEENLSEYNDTDQYLLKSAFKKIALNDLLKNSSSLTNPKAIEEFVSSRNMSMDVFEALVDYYLENNLGFDGIIQTKPQEVLIGIKNLIEKEEEPLESNSSDDDDEDLSKYASVGTDSDDMDESIIDHDPTSMVKDPGTGTLGSSDKYVNKQYQIDEDKINQPDYKYYLINGDKIESGWEFKEDARDAFIEMGKPEGYKLYTKSFLMNNLGMNPDNDVNWLKESVEYFNLKKEINEMLNKVNNVISEDRKPSNLVLLDRLRRENEKNTKSDFSKSNTEKTVKKENEIEKTLTVDNPYALNDKIEKDVIKRGDEAKNVGNSTNQNPEELELLKRNLTEKENDEIDVMRNGMHSLVYDNKPDESFIDRMEKNMGQKLTDVRNKQIKSRANMPMYNKDSQPTDQGIESQQYNKYRDGYNKQVDVKESVLSAKYIDESTKQYSFIDFNISEAKEIDKVNPDFIELNFNGLGNTISTKFKLNEGVAEFLDTHKFYISENNEIFYISSAKVLNESVEAKPKLNESFEKLKRLMKYNTSEYIDTRYSKVNRGF